MSKLQERLRDILTNAPPEPYTRKGEEMYHTLTKAADALDAMEKALRDLIAANNCNYDRDAMRYAGMFARAKAALANLES